MVSIALTPDSGAHRTRSTRQPVVLIGFQEQANLGLGYLASTLRHYGYPVHVFDFEQEPRAGDPLPLRDDCLGPIWAPND